MNYILLVNRYKCLVFLTLIICALQSNAHKKFQENNLNPVLNADSHKNYYIDNSIINHKGLTKLLATRVKHEKNTFHVFSLGRPGQLFIGNKWLSPLELKQHFIEIPNLNKYTKINIYGREFAKGDTGIGAVLYLKHKLNLDISASNDITGIDGDWELEVGNNFAYTTNESDKQSL